MKKKLWYIIPLLLLVLGLLGPVIHLNYPAQNSDIVGGVSNLPPHVQDSSGETPNKMTITSEIGGSNQDKKDVQTTTAPGSSPASGTGAISSQVDSDNSEEVVVNIAVVGKNRELLFGPGTVKIPGYSPRGTTALGALAATCLPYEASKRFPDLVEDIAGLSNKGQAGWLYKVNDEVPLVAANKKLVASNDHVIWWYSSSINEPAPSWEQLTN